MHYQTGAKVGTVLINAPTDDIDGDGGNCSDDDRENARKVTVYAAETSQRQVDQLKMG